MTALLRALAFLALLDVKMTVLGVSKVAAAKPLNFTAIRNGDAWKHKKAELLENAQSRKVSKAKAAAQAKADALEKARLKKIEKDQIYEQKMAEVAEKKRLASEKKAADKLQAGPHTPKTINFTKAFSNNSLLNGSLVDKISLAVEEKKSHINLTGMVGEKVGKATGFFGRLFHRNRPAPTQPPCNFPLPGDKVVYMIQGAQHYDGDDDGKLTKDGKASLAALRSDPRFARAFGHGKERAQVVIMGPMRKTLETAWGTFHEVLPDVKWEIDMGIRGTRRESKPNIDLGWDLLHELNFTKELMDEYESKLVAGDHGTVEDRWKGWIDRMRARSDTGPYIVVTHRYGCAETGVDIPEGGVRILALKRDPPEEFGYVAYGGNAWRQLSQPSCWPNVDDPTANHTQPDMDVVPEM